MNKSYSQDEVEKILKKYGIKLLSKYIKSDQSLEMICNCGKRFKKSFKTMNRNKNFGCHECIKNTQSKKSKLSYQQVKENIEKYGNKLLSDEYVNSKYLLKIECPYGHIFHMNYNNLMRGHGCPKCSQNYRYNYDEVKEIIKDLGFELLSEEYKNSNDNLKIKCSKGHIFYRSFSNIKLNPKCPECEGKMTYNIDYIKEFASKEELIILNDEYIPTKKLNIKCNKGHVFYRSWDNLRKSSKCPICTKQSKITYEFVIDQFSKSGYKVLTEKEDYNNTKSMLNVLCPNDKIWKTNYNQLSLGHNCGCEKCNSSHPNKRHSYEYVKEYIESQGEKLISKKYINNRTKIEIECKEGHVYDVKFNNYKDSGTRCPKCERQLVYKGEKRISEWLESNGFNDYIPQKQFKGLKGLRGGNLSYDFYLQKQNILIEYQGEFHDGTAGGQSKDELERQIKHDKKKTLYAKNNNIKLLEIWYWDFDNIEEILNRELIK